MVLETDEVDPVDQADGEVGFIGEGDAAQGADWEGDVGQPDEFGKGEGKWTRREEELVGSTRPVSDWLPMDFAGKGAEARVRVLSLGTSSRTMK